MLLLCTRKASDEAVSDAEGLRDVGARVGLCGRCMQEAGLREERARTPERSGASRRRMGVNASAGGRTEMSESMDIAKERLFHACGGGWLQVSSWECKEGQSQVRLQERAWI